MKIISIVISSLVSLVASELLIAFIKAKYLEMYCAYPPVQTDIGIIRVSSYACGLHPFQSVPIYITIFIILFIFFQFLFNKYF
jgi:hypothetical protein